MHYVRGVVNLIVFLEIQVGSIAHAYQVTGITLYQKEDERVSHIVSGLCRLD